MPSVNQFQDKDFGICKILFEKKIDQEDVCLFASFTVIPFIPEYVYYYLREIVKAGISVYFISSSPINVIDTEKLKLLVHVIIEKENKGTDFGAWCATLRWINYGQQYKNVYLCNDSVFGPFVPISNIHNKFMSVNEDVLGITDSYQGGSYHIQSYFIGIKQNVLLSGAWKNFWTKMTFHQDKRKIIDYYEIGFTKVMLATGFKCFIIAGWSKKLTFENILHKVITSETIRARWLNRVLYEQGDIMFDINPNSFLWAELINECGSPFIKRELFIYTNLYEECELEPQWIEIVSRKNYPIRLIQEFRLQYFLYKNLKTAFSEYKHFEIEQISVQNIGGPMKEGENFLFGLLKKSLPFTTVGGDYQCSVTLQEQLRQAKIDFFPIRIKSAIKNEGFDCFFLHIPYHIATLNHSELVEIKALLKKINNPIFITDNRGSRAVAANLLSLREDLILLDQDFFSPSDNPVLIDFISRVLTNSEYRQNNFFKRPTMAGIVTDIVSGSNNTGFINNVAAGDLSLDEYDKKLYGSRDDYYEYVAAKKKYHLIYENTPIWYKVLGHLLKLLTGHKKIAIKISDKGIKEQYTSTARDINHWYYIQYEVLPKWYKTFGKFLIKKKLPK